MVLQAISRTPSPFSGLIWPFFSPDRCAFRSSNISFPHAYRATYPKTSPLGQTMTLWWQFEVGVSQHVTCPRVESVRSNVLKMNVWPSGQSFRWPLTLRSVRKNQDRFHLISVVSNMDGMKYQIFKKYLGPFKADIGVRFCPRGLDFVHRVWDMRGVE